MCDYCDCRSHPQVAALSDDHERLLALLTELGAAASRDDSDTAADLVRELHEMLEDHATREERGVFTQLREIVLDDQYVAMFERDHDEVHRLLRQCAGDEWQRPASELIHVLREHILREETDLFPAAHQMLAPTQWMAVDAAVSRIATQEQRS